MKKILILLIFIFSFDNYLYLNCCDLPPGCEDKEFPYFFCNSNNLLTRCSNDPFNEMGFRAFKKCSLNTSLIDYITTGFPLGGGIEWSDPTLPANQKTVISLSGARNDAKCCLSCNG